MAVHSVTKLAVVKVDTTVAWKVAKLVIEMAGTKVVRWVVLMEKM